MPALPFHIEGRTPLVKLEPIYLDAEAYVRVREIKMGRVVPVHNKSISAATAHSISPTHTGCCGTGHGSPALRIMRNTFAEEVGGRAGA